MAIPKGTSLRKETKRTTDSDLEPFDTVIADTYVRPDVQSQPQTEDVGQQTDYIFRGLPVLEYVNNARIPGLFLYKEQELIKGMSNAQFIGWSMASGENVKIIGPAGCGKSTIFLWLAANANRPVMRINFQGEITYEDFIGHLTRANGNVEWSDGSFTYAWKRGYLILLEELNVARPEIKTALHACLELGGDLEIPMTHELIKRHPMTLVASTENPVDDGIYSGVIRDNEATNDRWQILNMNYLPLNAEIEVVQHYSSCHTDTARYLCTLAVEIREHFGKDLMAIISTRTLIRLAKTANIMDVKDAIRVAYLPRLRSSDVGKINDML